jgi:hypothetical protein
MSKQLKNTKNIKFKQIKILTKIMKHYFNRKNKPSL